MTTNDRYRALFDSASVPLALLSADGRVLEVNQRWGSVLGVDPATLVGKTISDFAPPGTAAELMALYRQSLDTDTAASRAPTAVLRPDGKIIFMDFTNIGITLDGQACMLTSGIDVTTEVQSTLARAKAEGHLRDLVARTPDMIWTARAEGQIEYITPNVERITGYTVAETIAGSAQGTWPLVDSDDRPRVIAAFRKGFETQTPFQIEYRRRRKDGMWRWVRNRTFAYTMQPGGLRAEGVLSDITDQRDLEDALRQSQKIEAIGQLTGGIAHDFNNLLSAILASSAFLIEDLAEGDPRREDAVEIKRAAERAASLTRQLLTFSRRQAVSLRPVDFNATIAGLQKMLVRLIGEDVALVVTMAPDAGHVRADAGQLEQVIVNLAVNARDAMPKGGTLTLRTEPMVLSADAAAAVDAAPGPYLALSVTDTGIGMDAETRRRLFEPFFTTKPVGKGTGLGLSTSYGIVKQGGGFITVDSTPGQGTTFRVCLPSLAEPVGAEALAQAASLGGHGETVLVVEDDDGVRAAVGRILKSRGYRVLVARGGDEAVRQAVESLRPIDLVVSDVVMAGQQGPQVVDALRAPLQDDLYDGVHRPPSADRRRAACGPRADHEAVHVRAAGPAGAGGVGRLMIRPAVLLVLVLLLLAACGGPAPIPPAPDAGHWWDAALGGCAPRGPRPRTVGQVVERLNALPAPAGAACFVASLPRPLAVAATVSTFSAQPADGRRSPRLFFLDDQLILSVVPAGPGAPLLEFGERIGDGRTLKAELTLPAPRPIAPEAPYLQVQRGPSQTSCGLCHRAEAPHPTVDGGFVSAAFRPNPGELVPLAELASEVSACDPAVERDRCLMLIAVFGFGAVQQAQFPGTFELFIP